MLALGNGRAECAGRAVITERARVDITPVEAERRGRSEARIARAATLVGARVFIAPEEAAGRVRRREGWRGGGLFHLRRQRWRRQRRGRWRRWRWRWWRRRRWWAWRPHDRGAEPALAESRVLLVIERDVGDIKAFARAVLFRLLECGGVRVVLQAKPPTPPAFPVYVHHRTPRVGAPMDGTVGKLVHDRRHRRGRLGRRRSWRW